jgi:hypothetical protein
VWYSSLPFLIILNFGTIIVYEQLNYIQTKNLGYNRDQVLIIDALISLNKNLEPSDKIEQQSGILNVNNGSFTGYQSNIGMITRFQKMRNDTEERV